MASCEYDKCSLNKKGTEPSKRQHRDVGGMRIYGPNARPSYDHRVSDTLQVTNKVNENSQEHPESSLMVVSDIPMTVTRKLTEYA